MKTALSIYLIIKIVVVAAVVIAGYTAYRKIKRKISSFLSLGNLTAQALQANALEQENQPKSLRGMDALLLPKIMKDFPDFNVNLAKTNAKEEIGNYLPTKSYNVHNVVISDYKTYGLQKVIIFQLALEYTINGTLTQKRYDMNYSYIVEGNGKETHVAGNCPNCGAPFDSFSSRICRYCDTPIVDIQGLTWKFTEVKES